MIATALIGALQLVRFAAPQHPSDAPDSEADRAGGGGHGHRGARRPPSAALALLGDKRFLFSDSGRSFVMYGVQGRSWVAMGAPIGLAAERLELLWRFRERCDLWGGRTVFYEIGPEVMPDLVELGLTFYKLGEQASCRWPGSTSTDRPGQGCARPCGGRSATAPSSAWCRAEGVPALMPELRAVSDAWLASKSAREKGFSLGRFDPGYLARFPVAIVRKGPELVAFANLWPTADRRELSIDLMRFRDGALRDVMDYLFVQLLLWGKGQGYGRFDLGMAPLSGLQERQLAHVVDPRRRPAVHPRREALQFRGAAALQGEVQADLGAALPGGTRRAWPSRRSWPTSPSWSAAAPSGSCASRCSTSRDAAVGTGAPPH